VGEFLRGMKVPTDVRKVIERADDVLLEKMGLREWVGPSVEYIRTTFNIQKPSLLDLDPTDLERIISDVLQNEVLLPLSNNVYDAYLKARDNTMCAKFVFCQLNHQFYQENFIRRNIVKTASIISAFQAANAMKKDAFSGLYEAVQTGADGFDCTHGVSNFCLDLMHTTSHNEL